MPELPESPISVNFRVKSPGGFEYQITMRKGVTAEDFTDMMTLITEKEDILLKKKFTAVAGYAGRGGFGRGKAEPEYVEGVKCPDCGSRVVKGIGKIKEKCEKYNYDFKERKNVGTCEYIVWN